MAPPFADSPCRDHATVAATIPIATAIAAAATTVVPTHHADALSSSGRRPCAIALAPLPSLPLRHPHTALLVPLPLRQRPAHLALAITPPSLRPRLRAVVQPTSSHRPPRAIALAPTPSPPSPCHHTALLAP